MKTSLREKPKHLWREGKQGEGWGAAAEKVSCEQLWREGGHALRAPWEPRPCSGGRRAVPYCVRALRKRVWGGGSQRKTRGLRVQARGALARA